MKESKVCPVCKRPFTNRKSWKLRGQWQDVIYCSDRCRKSNTKVKNDLPQNSKTQ